MDYSSLKGYIPDSIYDQIAAVLSFGIDGPLRLSHLLGQAQEESADFTEFTENLNYSAQALWTLFHTHFTDQAECDDYARHSEKIANRIYANRLGNGNEQSGDGWLYRGKGCIQLTGKSNQQNFFTAAGLPINSDPNLIATTYSLISAAWFFKVNNLWLICDLGISTDTITTITKHVNGGLLGLDKRIQYTQNIHSRLTS